LQKVDPEFNVLVLTSGGSIYDDIDSELVTLPTGTSIAICPLHLDPLFGEQKH
jgi:hypothetical protein